MLFPDTYSFDSKSICKYFKNQPPHNGNGDFTDPLFPPNRNSLLALNSDGQAIDEQVYEKNKSNFEEDKIEWKRVSEIFSEYDLYVGKIETDDIKQGSLGNCYFLSALAALTQFPRMITNLFRSEKNHSGYYELILFIDGEWQVVIVDDFFPVSTENKNLLFCKPNMNEIWAILLEKAWAKVNGGYLNTVGGLCGEVLQVLTGYPYRQLNNIEIPRMKLWQIFYEAHKNNFVIGSGTGEVTWMDKVGLASNHAYSILRLEEVELNGYKYKLIKLRNPWGKTEWNGEWSDNSPIWTEELKKKLNLEVKEDGTFWMSFDEYVRFFDQADIAYVQFNAKNYTHLIDDAETLRHPQIYELSITSPSQLTVCLISKLNRFNRHLKKGKKDIGFTAVIVALDENGNPDHILKGSYSTWNGCLGYMTNLEAGHYQIFIHSGGVTDPSYGQLSVKFGVNSFSTLKYVGYDENFEILRSLTQKKIVEEYRNLYENFESYSNEIPGFMEKYGVFPIFLKNNRRKPVNVEFNLYMNFGVSYALINGKEYPSKDPIKLSLKPYEGYVLLMVASLELVSPPFIGIGTQSFEILPIETQVEAIARNTNRVFNTNGNFFSYFISSLNEYEKIQEFEYSGKASLEELYSELNFNTRLYEYLKLISHRSEFEGVKLVWKKVELEDKVYYGQLNMQGKFHGIGLLEEGINIYCGYFLDGVKEIYGKNYMKFSDDNIQSLSEGAYKNNKLNGSGKSYINEKVYFIGKFINNEKIEGFTKFADNIIWKGNLKTEKQHGDGILYFQEEKIGFQFEYEWNDPIINVPFSVTSARELGLVEVPINDQEFYSVNFN